MATVVVSRISCAEMTCFVMTLQRPRGPRRFSVYIAGQPLKKVFFLPVCSPVNAISRKSMAKLCL